MNRFRHAAALLAASAALFVAVPAATAADAPPSAERLALARKLFAEMNMEQMTGAVMRQMAPTMTAQARKANPALTEEQAKAITEAVAESSAALMGKVMERMVPLYASTFSEKELKDVLAFYDGPSGKAFLQKAPELAAKMGPMMVDLMPEMMADVQKRICAKTDCSKLNAPPRS